MQGQQQGGFTGFPKNYILQNLYTQPLYSQIPNTYTSLIRANPQRVKTVEEKSEDPKYDFIFAVMQNFILKLSDMNYINSKKVSELDPNTLNRVKAVEERINQVHKTTVECKVTLTAVNSTLSNKTEEAIKNGIYGVKNIYMKLNHIKHQHSTLSTEFETYSNIIKSFEDSYQRIKHDTRQVYLIPSKVVSSVVSILLKKVQTLQLDVEDLIQHIETQTIEDSRQDSDDINNYAAICEALYFNLQELVLKANNVFESIQTLKQRIYGRVKDNHGQGGLRIEPEDNNSVFKEDVYTRLDEIIKKIN